jgi:hypothetical protein
MFLILMLFMLSSVQSQETCDPAELEKECYNLICTTALKNILLDDSSEFNERVSKHPYVLDSHTVGRLTDFIKMTDSIKVEVEEKLIKKNGIGKASKLILGAPYKHITFLEKFFKDDFSCVMKNNQCELIVNDMGHSMKEMAEVFKRISNLGLDEKKSLYKNKKESLRFEKILTAAISLKLEEYKKIQLSRPELTSKLTDSCKLADYIFSSLEKINGGEEFLTQINQSLDAFKSRFLPLLSEHSSHILSSQIFPKNFSLIKSGIKLPVFKDRTIAFDDTLTDELRILLDAGIVSKSSDIRCSLSGAIPKDYFSPAKNQIAISKLVIASGASDVITHEIGHWLEAKMKGPDMSGESVLKFNKVQACIKTFYAKNDLGDKLSEDFADWVVAKAGGGENRIFCDITKMHKKYSLLKKSLFASRLDEHSSELFRELNILINRNGSLPKVCQNLIDAYPDAQPRKCDF